MVNKYCCYGDCKSDSRKAREKFMLGVKWVLFPQRKTQLEKCKRWVRACSRQNWDEMDVTRNTYICSKHFVGGDGPTQKNPDPIPAYYSSNKVSDCFMSTVYKVPHSCILNVIS